MLIAAVPPLVVGWPTSRMPWTVVTMNLGVFGAVALGPVLGGLQEATGGWRLLFWVVAGLAGTALQSEPPAHVAILFLPEFGTALLSAAVFGALFRTRFALALFVAGFSLRSAQIRRVFALVEPLRGVAAFITAPLLLHLATTASISPQAGIGTAVWVCFGIAAAGGLIAALLFVLGRARLQRPNLERWEQGDRRAWESPPLLAGVRRAPGLADQSSLSTTDRRRATPTGGSSTIAIPGKAGGAAGRPMAGPAGAPRSVRAVHAGMASKSLHRRYPLATPINRAL
jgi:MFS family permease